MGHEMTKATIISSLLWKLLERSGTQGIQFIVTIILARLLLPEDFGLIVLITIFISLAGVIAQGGFNAALIQKKSVDEVDLSSVFYFNLFLTTILYILLFMTAPFIASYFAQPSLMSILRILSITLFIGTLNSIQHTIIARNMQFKKLFFSSLGGIILSASVGIVMAYNGFGVWALVAQQLVNQFFITVALWCMVQWRPKLLFSIERLRSLFSFGWKLLLSSVLDTAYSDIKSLLIGKVFSPAVLGFYNRGEQLPGILINNINGSIQSVMFPALSSQQENRQRMKGMVRRSIIISSFIIIPMMVGLAVTAEHLVKVLLTEKWLPTVPLLQLFCMVYALWPIHTANLQAINALGRSDIFLKLEIVKKIIGVVILLITIQYGVHAVVIGSIVGGVISLFLNAYPTLKLLDYSIKEQFADIWPSLFISLIMGLVVFSIQWINLPDIFMLFVQLLFGIAIYIGLAKACRLECFTYLLTAIKETVRSNRRLPGKEIYK